MFRSDSVTVFKNCFRALHCSWQKNEKQKKQRGKQKEVKQRRGEAKKQRGEETNKRRSKKEAKKQKS